MAATHGVGTYGNAVGTVTPLDHKMAQLGLVVKTAANTIRSGLFWDGNTTVVSGKANMSYDVRAFTAVTSRGATAGAVLLSNDAVYNVTTTAAPGSNSRYDVVYLWQREYSLDGTDSNPVIGVVQGTAAASPTVPSLAAFPGAIELARILVPSGVTATNSGTTITQTAPFTATAGGIVPVRNTTERDAGSWVESQHVWDISTDIIWLYTGAAWVRGAITPLQLDTTNSTPAQFQQIGMGKIVGNGTATVTEAVTFPTAFSTTPLVIVSGSGLKTPVAAFAANGLTVAGYVIATAFNVSTTGFNVNLTTYTGVLGASADFYYTWMAIGS